MIDQKINKTPIIASLLANTDNYTSFRLYFCNKVSFSPLKSPYDIFTTVSENLK